MPFKFPERKPVNFSDELSVSYSSTEITGDGLDDAAKPYDVEIVAEADISTTSITNMQTLMHIFKGNIGTGILSLPMAVKNAGLWTGLAGILCVSGIAVHCMHMLIGCNEILCKRTGNDVLDYAGVMEMSFKTGPIPLQRFSRFVRPFVDALLIFTQLGACCVYIVFIAKNVQMVVGYFVSVDLDVTVYEVCVMVVLVPFACIRNLRLLAPFSAFANVLTVAGLIIIIQYIVQGLPDTSKRPAFSSFGSLPLFFGTAIFTVEGIGLVLPLKNSMRRPQDFAGWFGVLNLGMCATVCLYATIGFYGYLKFGDQIQSTITLSLPDDKLYVSVRLIFAIAILITYNIQFYVPITISWPRISRLIKQERLRTYGEYVFRITVVFITFGFAAAIPHIDLLISLIGAVACSFLALILPALIEIITLVTEDAPVSKVIVVKDVLIFLFGIFGTVIGTYTSLTAIIDTF
ncbi:unnamed protein product [Candidula unifasciata]|uniref:Amino acid transporter transmembrane domain-containing protein n=1 Tax=Candidula unifasciata TaxID=100452 RepID=A0A8S3ZYZ1_9EUPU|nr:unnamed protein product [Candidula unifasciata]